MKNKFDGISTEHLLANYLPVSCRKPLPLGNDPVGSAIREKWDEIEKELLRRGVEIPK